MRRSCVALMVLGISWALVPGPGHAQSVGEVFRKVNPSVVVIRAKGRDVTPAAGGLVRYNETGSGVLISADGKVITAAHVVNAVDEITVELVGGAPVSARVVSSEPAADLSLLQLDSVPTGAVPARMANSDTVRVGDQVLVIGAPYGLSHALTVGWISARWPPNTVYKSMPLAEFFQTDAVINMGNSGGPMFNMAGELAAIFNVPQATGYLVKTVAKGSPGWDMGLMGGDRIAVVAGEQVAVGGDIILSVEGLPVGQADDHEKIRDILSKKAPGAPFSMKILRAGKILDLTGKTP